MTGSWLAAGLLSTIGLGSALAIYVAHRLLPEEDPALKAASEIKELLPGADCGACGHPGCFAYARALAESTRVIMESPCRVLAADADATQALNAYLGVDASEPSDALRAIIHCTGHSPDVGEFFGISSCSAATQVAGGFKTCSYGCLGFGDCSDVCPVDAIRIHPETQIARIDGGTCIGCGLCVTACPKGLIELISRSIPQYLGCNYLAVKDIPGREKCSEGCLHCKLCVRVSDDGEAEWNEDLQLPAFGENLASVAIEKCPRSVIHKL